MTTDHDRVSDDLGSRMLEYIARVKRERLAREEVERKSQKPPDDASTSDHRQENSPHEGG